MKCKHVSAALIPLALAISALPAQAENGLYFSASLGAMTSDVSGYDTFSTQNVFAKVGKQIAPGLAVEGLLGLGIGSDTWSNGCDGQEVSTDSFIGAQVVGSVPMSPKASFHGTLGFIQTSASVKISGTASCYGVAWSESYSDDKTDLSYGIGVDYKLNEKSAITADYQFFYNNSISGVDVTISGLLIGYKQEF